MKKLLVILGILLALGIAAVLVLAFSLGSIVQRSVNEIGPRVTQTAVVLEGAKISPLSGVGTLTGLTVGNPEGWTPGNAFSLGQAHLDLEPRTLLGGPIVIEELIIEQPRFFYEQRLTGGSNIKQLIENIQKAAGTAERPIGEPETPPKKFIVKKLRLHGAQVTVGIGPTAAVVPLPELSYDNLGVQEGGLTGGQLARVVLDDVLGRILAVATTKGLLSLPTGAAGKTLESIGQGLQQLMGGKKEPAPSAEKTD